MLPELQSSKTYRQVQDSFASGLWHRQGQKQGTFYAGENLCGADHPALASRSPRQIWQMLSEGAQGMYCADGLYLVSDRELLRAKAYLQLEPLGTLSEGDKAFACLGEQILILPDFAVFDTAAERLVRKGVTLKLGQVLIQNQNYVDQDGIARAIRFNTLHCVDFPFTDFFEPGDSILLQGTLKNDGAYTVREVEQYDLRFDENSFVAEDIVNCTLTNRPPQMTQMCGCGGRLWGFVGSDIYASALGEPANWYRYDGDAESSYKVHVPGEGTFTACISHGGHPVFFKSGSMVEIFGDCPENFAVSETHLSGVKKDSAASLCSVGGDLLYLSDNGVMRCSGSHTELISEALGTTLSQGFATTDGRRYWLCAVDASGTRRLYVYDTHYQAWYVEDGQDLCALAYMEGQVYAYSQNGTVYLLGEDPVLAGRVQGQVSSSVELYPLEDVSRGKITPLQLGVRVRCESGCQLALWVSYDGGAWQKRAELQAQGERLWYVPLSPQSCFTLGIRIEGEGAYSIRSVVKEYR